MSEPVQSDISTPDAKGLIFACKLDNEGGGTLVDWPEVLKWQSGDGPIWVHLDRLSPDAIDWLETGVGLSDPTLSALLAEETRPRVFHGIKGSVAIMRGINLNTGSDPEDMVSVRIWSDGQMLISLRSRRVMSLQDVLSQLIDQKVGPRNASELFERLISQLTVRMAETVASIDERLDEIEANVDIKYAAKSRRELSELRQEAIMLRRYLSPQREALSNLQLDPPKWLEDRCRVNIRESVDRLMRYIESMDTARERSLVVKDDIANQLSESTNRTLYVLSIVSAIFLPLGFITGLLGINVGGMPGTENPYAFWISSVIMLVIVVVEIFLFKKLKWLV